MIYAHYYQLDIVSYSEEFIPSEVNIKRSKEENIKSMILFQSTCFVYSISIIIKMKTFRFN